MTCQAAGNLRHLMSGDFQFTVPSRRLAGLVSLVVAVAALSLAVPARAADYLYYSMPTGNIGKTNIDGTGSATTFFAGDAAGVAANSTNIFWSDPVASAVKKATTSGTGVGTLASVPLGASVGFQVAIDSTYAYYAVLTGPSSASIGRARLDGTGSPNATFVTGLTSAPFGLAVDANYVYWSYTGNNSGSLFRANLNTGVTDTIVTGLAGNNVRAIAVTPTHVYWINRTQGSIGRANIDGSGSPNSNFITGIPNGQGLAASGSYLYWTTTSPATYIGRTNIDGSGSPNANFISVPGGAIGVAAETSIVPTPTSYALSVTRAGTGSGTVTSSPAGIDCGSTCSAEYASGTSVTLTAAAASGSTFGGWSGACSGTGASCTVSMSQAQSVTATFDPVPVPPPPPSNTFKVRTPLLAGKAIRTLVAVPGPGVIRQEGAFSSGGKVRQACRSGALAASKAGVYRMRCRLTDSVRASRRKGAVKVLLVTTYKPTGGTANVVVRTVVLRSLKPRYTG